MVKNINQYLIVILFLLLVSCSFKFKKAQIENEDIRLRGVKTTIFDNIIIIDEKKCDEKGLPITSFAIEYPDSIEIDSAKKADHVEFIYKDSNGVLIESLSIGSTINVDNEEKAILTLKNLFSKINIQVDSFIIDTISELIFNEKKSFVARGIVNYPEGVYEGFAGNYLIYAIIQFPKSENINAVLFFMAASEDSEIKTFEDFENRGMIGKVIQTFRYIE